ncbi:MAG: CCA tRNA nucleotidyltransferase [Chloroflexi bacterium]|nr:CCA tRNA nucleotidyltransferase [Chloroflexota bacterium]
MKRKRSDLLGEFESALGERFRPLSAAIEEARRRRIILYLVGGGVRDLLLGEPAADYDVVAERDALSIASAIARKLAAKVVAHPRFGTAVVRGEGFRLDLAGARTEEYQRPGALPSVRPAAFDRDLARRDFTINAMALQLNGAEAGRLIDPHGGERDLARRFVRILHDGSFQDDATRVFRALRYAARLRFEIEPHTAALLRRDRSYVDTISGVRVRREFELIALESSVEAALRNADAFGALAAAHPAMGMGPAGRAAAVCAAVGRLAETPASHRGALLFCLLLAGASEEERESAVGRLALTGLQAAAVRGFSALVQERPLLNQASLLPSAATRMLEPQPPLAIEAFVLLEGSSLAAGRGRRYLESWRFVRPRLDGDDVESLGIPHGPQVGEALAALREARLDGKTESREDEEALIKRMRPRDRALAGGRRG